MTAAPCNCNFDCSSCLPPWALAEGIDSRAVHDWLRANRPDAYRRATTSRHEGAFGGARHRLRAWRERPRVVSLAMADGLLWGKLGVHLSELPAHVFVRDGGE